jgi:steroid delta-isomerase-like uncharacterized protein
MSPSSRSEIEAAARRFYHAIETGDEAAVDQTLAANWECFPPLRHGAGPEGYKHLIDGLRKAFPDMTVVVEDVIVEGDKVAVRSVARGTHSADLMGIPATGRPVEYRACDIHRVLDGRIVQSWHLEDFFGLLGQLGATFGASS